MCINVMLINDPKSSDGRKIACLEGITKRKVQGFVRICPDNLKAERVQTEHGVGVAFTPGAFNPLEILLEIGEHFEDSTHVINVSQDALFDTLAP